MFNEIPATKEENDRQATRQEYIKRFGNELKDIISNAKNTKNIGDGFDRIFYMIQRLIRYTPQAKLSEKVQSEIFTDICDFINQIYESHHFSFVFNTFPKTSINDYCDKTIGEQFSQLSRGKNRDNDLMPEGGSCRYRTLLLYNIFNKLRESGLDLEIKFFRLKVNTNNQQLEMGHSGLVITFQGQYYVADWNMGKPIIGEINYMIEEMIVQQTDKLNKVCTLEERCDKSAENEIELLKDEIELLESLITYHSAIRQYISTKEADDIIFFDNLKDFVNNQNTYTADKNFGVYLKLDNPNGEQENNKFSCIDFSFIEGGFTILVNNKKLYAFYLNLYDMYIKSNNNGYNFYYMNNSPLELLETPSQFLKTLRFVYEGDKHVREMKPCEINQDIYRLLECVLPIIFERSTIKNEDYFPDSGKDIRRILNQLPSGQYIPYQYIEKWAQTINH